MKVALERTFPIPAGAEAAWALLSDVEATASCMPGAAVTERVDDRHFKGTVKVKLGPATLSFRGDIEVQERDAGARRLHLVAKGTDTSGTSVASMDLSARIEAADDGTSRLIGVSEASLGGKAATFGGRMMNAVADQMLKQFAANFAGRLGAAGAGSGAPEAGTTAPGADVAPTEGPVDLATGRAAGASSPGASPAASFGSAGPASTAAAVPQAAPVQPVSGLALLWAVIRDWLRGLFSRKAA